MNFINRKVLISVAKKLAILLEKQGKLSEMINNWDQAIHHDIK